MLLALKYRGSVQAIEQQYAGRVLLDLHEQARKRYGGYRYQDFRNRGGERFHKKKRNAKGKIPARRVGSSTWSAWR